MAAFTTINNQYEFWDRVADDKTFTIPVDIALLQNYLKPDARILDFGCGYGRICGDLRRAGFTNTLGVDSAPSMIRRAKQLHPGFAFELLDSPNAGAPVSSSMARGAFDAVLLVAVLTCIPEDDAQQDLISRIGLLLRPGGLLCVSDFILQKDDRNLDRYGRFADEYGTWGVFRLDEGAVVRHHSPEYLDQLLSGFETIERDFREVVTMNGHRAVSYHWLGRKNQG